MDEMAAMDFFVPVVRGLKLTGFSGLADLRR
jgi:hypothetical protein